MYGWASGRVYFMTWDYTDGTNLGVDVNQEGLGKMGEKEDYMERKDYMERLYREDFIGKTIQPIY